AYHLKASQIEWTEKRQWIGRGFDYQDSDAQRVYIHLCAFVAVNQGTASQTALVLRFSDFD
ncbi:hypothetical protein, partial [Vibrio cincinnatiensis]|uniref:hypothetical protein n=1 Tax=Vibrio cincinnatiensis TaxID=675 RepID=UPI001EDD3740